MPGAITDREKRIGNMERDQYADYLAFRVSTGHLKPEEFTERRDAALAAVTAGDLVTLTADLPPMPGPKQHLVTLDWRGRTFSPARWAAAMAADLALISGGPILARVFHGLDHAPLEGSLPGMLILAGVIVLLVGGILLAPGMIVKAEDR
jgi:uncharacterized protein DUF1707